MDIKTAKTLINGYQVLFDERYDKKIKLSCGLKDGRIRIGWKSKNGEYGNEYVINHDVDLISMLQILEDRIINHLIQLGLESLERRQNVQEKKRKTRD
jgi:hypothetical protein